MSCDRLGEENLNFRYNIQNCYNQSFFVYMCKIYTIKVNFVCLLKHS